MASGPTVTPLRINKQNAVSSQDPEPIQSASNSNKNSTPSRPLSDLSPMERRRNSPSSTQAANKMTGNDEIPLSSPFPSPYTVPKSSPRAFWQGKDSQENRPQGGPGIDRKSSLEKLKRASRVQNNSKLFSLPTTPVGRPMSYHGLQANQFATPHYSRNGVMRKNSGERERSKIPLPAAKKGDTPTRGDTPPRNTTKLTSIITIPSRASPTKSSLLSSYKTNSGDNGGYSDGEGYEYINRTPTRRPKSVTFDKEAPHVLEYELVTPDPSVDGSPSVRYDSDEEYEEDEDEEELENTPVIEPDDWTRRCDTPEAVPHAEDPFRATPSPNSRPLPPIPGAMVPRADSTSPSGNRPLPTLPFTKADIQAQGRMSLEERLRLVMSKGEPSSSEKRLSQTSTDGDSRTRDDGLGISMRNLSLGEENDNHQDFNQIPQEEEIPDLNEAPPISDGEPDGESISSYYGSAPEYEPPPRISRESIRRQVEERRLQSFEHPYTPVKEGVSISESGPYDDTQASIYSMDGEVQIKEERSDDESIDLYSIPEMYNVPQRPSSRFASRSPDPTDSECSHYDNDDESHYSDHQEDETEFNGGDGATTPTQRTPTLNPVRRQENEIENLEEGQMGLPELSPMFANDGLGLKDYMTPSPAMRPSEPEKKSTTPESQPAPSTITARDFLLRPDTPEEQPVVESEEEDFDSGSVIRHKIYHSESEEDEEEEELEDDEQVGEQNVEGRSPSPVEDTVATIRAPGGKLKTRPSVTPSDMAAMAAARRQVSGDQSLPPPPVPRIPTGYRSEGDVSGSSEGESDEEEPVDRQSDGEMVDTSRRSSSGKMKKSGGLPALGEFEFDLKMDDLSEEFDRVIEAQKRGYLMRQNTRVIHASSQDPDDTTRTPGHPGHERNQSWSVEPWRSQRRRSQRESAGGPLRKRPSVVGAVPPLPGKEGVTNKALPMVCETDADSRTSLCSEREENTERGRLFVKVVGVKDLALPLPQGQATYFCLTLDNGLHCVTTSWLELGKNAPIGQEFELVVMNDLEFQLTLQTKLEKPPTPPAKPVVKAPTKQKQSTFSRVFTSPKKRKQLEQQQQQELKQQQQQQRQDTPPPASAWDLLHGLVARDGSFARSYVCLKDFEANALGRPYTTDIICFNEWAVDTASVKSKKGMQGGLQPARKAPYKIGKLEVQLLFVPKTKGMSDKELPKSMNAAIREMREVEATMSQEWEGNLSQQGGDCPFWRRRYFKLVGPRLTAYHEATRQPRATINLSKAVKLIDDRNTLVDPNVAGPGKSRRKSGFSEEEEGYMYVAEGFRIRFANGEVIDFYADSAEDKKGWMKVFSETIGRVPEKRGWCDLVLAKESKERSERDRSQNAAARVRAAQQAMRQHPPTRPPPPPKNSNTHLQLPAPPPKSNRRPAPAHVYG